MRYRIVTPRSKDKELYFAALSRSGGKCEAEIPDWQTGRVLRNCGASPVTVCKLEDGTFVCYCETCRIAALGLSPGEKAAQSKAAKASQRTFWDDDL